MMARPQPDVAVPRAHVTSPAPETCVPNTYLDSWGRPYGLAMANSVLVDRPAGAGLAAAMLWMAPNQGRTVSLPAGRLEVGLVLAARRSVTCTVRLTATSSGQVLCGALSAVATTADQGVRLVFKGIPASSSAAGDVRPLASALLDAFAASLEVPAATTAA